MTGETNDAGPNELQTPEKAPATKGSTDNSNSSNDDTVPIPSLVDGEEEKALVRKIDLRLLPAIWLMYLLSYIDRTNIGNAKVAGLQDDLHLSSGQYSLALIVFFITYVLFEVPSNLFLSTTRPSLYLPTLMILWGALTACTAAVKTYQQLIAVRTLLGCLEAGFSPGVILLFSSWYKQEEQSKRFAVYMSAAILSGAFGGLLAGGIMDSLDGARGVRGWRWLFVIEGLTSIGWAVVSFFLLIDFPWNSRQFSERERGLAMSRLEVRKKGDGDNGQKKGGSLRALKLALSDYRTWLFTVGYMAIVGSSTLLYFYPTLVSGLGYKGTKAQYMTVPIYAVAFICVAISGYFCDKFSTRRGLVIASWLTLSLTCSIATVTVFGFKARYVLLVFLTAGLWSANAMSLSFASSTFSLESKGVRAVALAFINSMGNLAQIYGSYLFPDEDGPKYLKGFKVILAMCCVGIVVYSGLHFVIRRRSAAA